SSDLTSDARKTVPMDLRQIPRQKFEDPRQNSEGQRAAGRTGRRSRGSGRVVVCPRIGLTSSRRIPDPDKEFALGCRHGCQRVQWHVTTCFPRPWTMTLCFRKIQNPEDLLVFVYRFTLTV